MFVCTVSFPSQTDTKMAKPSLHSTVTHLLFGSVLLWTSLLFPVQAQQFSLQTYSVEAGLAQSQVYSMLEDSRGNLWFGTRGGGLSRFDGISFYNYSVQNGLTNNFIRSISEDSKGNLWIATDAGVSKYDGESFQPFEPLGNEPVHALLPMGEKEFWFATDRGILIRSPDPADTSQRLISQEQGLVHSTVFTLDRDSKGNIWAGTRRGLSILFPAPAEETGYTIRTYTFPNGLTANQISSVTETQSGKVWVTSYGGGVYFYDPETASLEDRRPFRRHQSEDFDEKIVFCSTEDRQGNLWLGTLKAGACRFDGEFYTWFTEEEGMYSNHVRSILEDSWGNLWIGTSGGGVSKFTGDQFVHFTTRHGLPKNRVYSVVEDTSGNIWMGTSGGGVNMYDGTQFYHFTAEDGLTDRVIKCAFRDDEGNLWLGSEGAGAFLYKDSTFTQFTTEDGLCNNWIKDILQDRDYNMWFASAGGGVCRLDTGGFTSIRRPGGLASDRTAVILEDQKQAIWVGTAGGGISRIQGDSIQSWAEEEGLCSPSIRSFSESKQGRVWLGTSNGLSFLDPYADSLTFACITTADGLASNNIYLTVFDEEENLWVGSEKGVDRIEFNQEGNLRQIRHFGYNEGFTGIETCQRAALKDSKGAIWFGTLNGLTRHNPTERLENSRPPNTHITLVRLFYEKLDASQYADSLTYWYGLPINLTLPYDQNHLGFEFIGINHKNPEKVRYKWMLEGLESEFSPPSVRREFSYSNLAPGIYTFKVMASNEDGIWNEAPATFSFVIEPPVWGTWWFRVSALLLVMLTGVIWYRWRIRRVERMNEEENRKIQLEKNVIELEQKALRLQMNPHFIFNALNSIKGCIAMNDTALARKHLVNFARLMRLTLDNSRESWIPLEKEVQTLELYLELEKLSKNDKFDYVIDLDPTLKADNDTLPPMLVQPFVENAVIHGISSLPEKGKITIQFQKQADHIVCTVEDNGIGRKRAASHKRSPDESHTSTGIAVTQERLEIMEQEEGAKFGIQFIDLEQAGTHATGTKVEIKMPFKPII